MSRTYGNFELGERIGSGGISTVFRGKHSTLGYPVAIKLLKPIYADDADFIARFELEAMSAANIPSDHIAKVIHHGGTKDDYFIVQEFVDGPDVSMIIRTLENAKDPTARFMPQIALLIIEETAHGLRDAHEQGIIHRDIKPSNILISKRGNVKIIDFGLARSIGDLVRLQERDLTQPGIIIGTPSYMSPEQAAGQRDIDHRSDIFSLGVMSYHMLTGTKPFQGATPTEVQERIVNDRQPTITSERCPLVDDRLRAVLNRMLEKSPARRFQSMNQVIPAIQECLQQMDPTGELSRNRQDFLGNFAKDPVPFSRRLHAKTISSHLKRGFHFKNLGLSNVDDALRELNIVISLDPKHREALRAIEELKKEVEESGRHLVKTARIVKPGETQRIPVDDAKPPPTRKPATTHWLRWQRLALGAAAVVIASLVIWKLISPRRTPIALNITSEPPGAAVWVRQDPSGVFHDMNQRSNCVLAGLGAGVWDIKLVLPGFVEQTRQISLAWGDTTSLDFSLEQRVTQGTLSVTSEPRGASVSVRPRGSDDPWQYLQGLTPISNVILEVGRWELRLERDGWLPDSRVIEIREEEDTIQRITLEEMSAEPEVADPGLAVSTESTSPQHSHEPSNADGFVQIASHHAADVYLGDSLVAERTTSLLLKIPGRLSQKVTLRIPEWYAEYRDQVTVPPSDTITVGPWDCPLGELRVSAILGNDLLLADITLDGKTIVGKAIHQIDSIFAGEHTISSRHEIYKVSRAYMVGPEPDYEHITLTVQDTSPTGPIYRISIPPDGKTVVVFEYATPSNQ